MKTRSNWASRVLRGAATAAVAVAAVFLGGCGLFADNWKLVWSDEFDGVSLDLTTWNYDLGTGPPANWGNNELEYYRAENITFEDFGDGDRGMVITAKEESFGGMNYTSGRINTKGKYDVTYGRIEARIKLPYGQGIWPAFWMLGADIDTNVWPTCGEIDIMEMVGHVPDTVHGTIHFGTPYQYEGRDYALDSGDFSDDFHVFALEWEPGELRWYVDDDYYSVKRNWWSSAGGWPAPFDKPFFLLLNLAVGGNWPGSPDGTTVFPQKMYVDYVRVYEK